MPYPMNQLKLARDERQDIRARLVVRRRLAGQLDWRSLEVPAARHEAMQRRRRLSWFEMNSSRVIFRRSSNATPRASITVDLVAKRHAERVLRDDCLAPLSDDGEWPNR
jgi:hypothetical protein